MAELTTNQTELLVWLDTPKTRRFLKELPEVVANLVDEVKVLKDKVEVLETKLRHKA